MKPRTLISAPPELGSSQTGPGRWGFPHPHPMGKLHIKNDWALQPSTIPLGHPAFLISWLPMMLDFSRMHQVAWGFYWAVQIGVLHRDQDQSPPVSAGSLGHPVYLSSCSQCQAPANTP